MSKLNDVAEELKTKLEAHAGLAGIPWHVDRQENIEGHVKKAWRKAKNGVVGTIIWAGNTKEPEATLRFDAQFVVELWGRSILQDGDNALDDYNEEIVKALDGIGIAAAAPTLSGDPAGTEIHHYHRARVGDTTRLETDTKIMRDGTDVFVTVQLLRS